MSTTAHPFAPEEIMAHLDGELSPARAQCVSTHMESCAACRELVTSLRNTSSALRSWTIGSVPERLENNVRESRSQFASGASNRFPRTHSWTRKQWIAGLAVTAAAAIFLLTISLPTLHRSPSAAQKAQATKSMDFARVNSLEEQQDANKKLYAMDESLTARSAPAPSASPQAVDRYVLRLQEKGKNSLPGSGLTHSAPMIARSVSLALIAKDFDSSRASLDAIVARHNGYAASLSVNTPQGAARTLQASLRIPAPQLPAALAEIKSLGRAESENQNGEEVTQQHADLVARLKNSRETELRLQAILTQRTGKISDVLEVEQEISRVRGEIEQMEGEQKNLEHRVYFATIDLQLSEEYKARLDSPAPAISTRIHNAAVNGYRNVADTLLAIVLFFAEYGPVSCFGLLVLLIPTWLVWRRWRHATAAI
jgi:hypothetical protein